MKCYKITAHLRSGFSASDPWSPSIDSILSYFQLKNRLGVANFNIYTALGKQTTCDDLPIEKVLYDKLWWYACSSPEFDSEIEIKRQYYKKFNIDYSLIIEKKVKNVELTKNQFKNYSLYFSQFIVKKISWHLICDIEKVKVLLSDCVQIGAKRGKGLGEVIGWEYSEGNNEKAKHKRPLPIEYAEKNNISGAIMYRGFRPSFRISENQTICLVKCS